MNLEERLEATWNAGKDVTTADPPPRKPRSKNGRQCNDHPLRRFGTRARYTTATNWKATAPMKCGATGTANPQEMTSTRSQISAPTLTSPAA
jgi:hypothetical protein